MWNTGCTLVLYTETSRRTKSVQKIANNAGYNNCADYVTSGVEAAYGGSLDLDDEEVVRYVLQNVSVSTVNEQFNSLRTVDGATVLKDPGELKSVYETMTGKKNPEPVEPMEVPSGIITDGIQQTGGY